MKRTGCAFLMYYFSMFIVSKWSICLDSSCLVIICQFVSSVFREVHHLFEINVEVKRDTMIRN